MGFRRQKCNWACSYARRNWPWSSRSQSTGSEHQSCAATPGPSERLYSQHFRHSSGEYRSSWTSEECSKAGFVGMIASAGGRVANRVIAAGQNHLCYDGKAFSQEPHAKRTPFPSNIAGGLEPVVSLFPNVCHDLLQKSAEAKAARRFGALLEQHGLVSCTPNSEASLAALSASSSVENAALRSAAASDLQPQTLEVTAATPPEAFPAHDLHSPAEQQLHQHENRSPNPINGEQPERADFQGPATGTAAEEATKSLMSHDASPDSSQSPPPPSLLSSFEGSFLMSDDKPASSCLEFNSSPETMQLPMPSNQTLLLSSVNPAPTAASVLAAELPSLGSCLAGPARQAPHSSITDVSKHVRNSHFKKTVATAAVVDAERAFDSPAVLQSPFEAVLTTPSDSELPDSNQSCIMSPFVTAPIFASGLTSASFQGSFGQGACQAPPAIHLQDAMWPPSQDTQQQPQLCMDTSCDLTPAGTSVEKQLFDLHSIASVTFKELSVKQRLGSGSFGVVFQAKPFNEVGFTAIKVMSGLRADDLQRNSSLWRSFQREWEACSLLRHRNIVRFERVFWYTAAPESGYAALSPGTQSLCIEMEYCSLGSLDRLMRAAKDHQKLSCDKQPRPASPLSMQRRQAARFADRRDVRLSLARQIAAALLYMHSQGLAHRDIRGTNIVLDIGIIDTPEGACTHSLVAKVCDFGACRSFLSVPKPLSDTDDVISLKYQAPEVLRDNLYGPKSDVFSFGVLLWEMMTLKEAWQDSTDAYVLRNAAHGAKLDWPTKQETGFFCHDDLRALVERCWESEATLRPTMKDVLADLQRISALESQQIHAGRKSAADACHASS